MFVDPIVVVLILTPIFMPLVNAAGIDPVLVGAIVTLQLAIGSCTPPFGCDIFTACAVFRKPYLEVIRGTRPSSRCCCSPPRCSSSSPISRCSCRRWPSVERDDIPIMRIESIQLSSHHLLAAPAARIGLIALATDLNSESDLRRMLPAQVEIYCNRVQHANPMGLEALRRVAADMPRAGRDLLPGVPLDVVVHGCTSGTIAMGETATLKLIGEARACRHATTPVTASLAALHHLGARRVSILTPYHEDVNRALGDYYASRGLEVINVSGFGMDDDNEMTAVSPEAIVEAGVQAMAVDADALFISVHRALRSSLAVDALEVALGRPVVTSNQAIVWHALQLSGVAAGKQAPGRLFDRASGSDSDADEIRLIDIYKARQRLHRPYPAHCAGALAEPVPAHRRQRASQARLPPDHRQLQAARGHQCDPAARRRGPPSGRDRGIDRQLRPRAGPCGASTRRARGDLHVATGAFQQGGGDPRAGRRRAHHRLEPGRGRARGRPAGRRGGPGPSAAFRSPDVIAGQGTAGLEVLEELPAVDTVLVPLSGGGLLAGVALAMKSASPAIRVIGVSMEHGCAMHASLRAGKPVQVEEVATLADSLGGGIGLDNRYTFRMVQALVDDTMLVSEEEIAGAIRHAYDQEQLILEAAGRSASPPLCPAASRPPAPRW